MNFSRDISYVFCIFLIVFIKDANAQLSDTIKTDRPQKGEGLYSFFLRHELSISEDLDSFFKLNEGKFGADSCLLAHHEYVIPCKSVMLYEPLYGKEREKYTLDSDEMKGSVFYLVSGHGGPDPGAIGKFVDGDLHEDEYAYDITLRLAKRLTENGAKVHMIIKDKDDGIRDERILQYDNHETCGDEKIPLDQVARLKQRTQKVNDLYKLDTEAYRRCVILHLDSRSKKKRIDVFFYHYKESKNGQKLAHALQAVFDSKYSEHQPSRGYSGTVSERNLFVLREMTPVCVFAELGNIQNYGDQKRFVIYENRQALANWMYEGLRDDFFRSKKK